MTSERLPATQTTDLLQYIDRWYERLVPFHLEREVQDPGRLALFSADMTVGFCREGNLASPRINDLTGPVVDLFQRLHQFGVDKFVLLQDTHDASTPEFNSFPTHCVRGTREAQPIAELQELPFSHQFTVIEKNALNPAIRTELDRWLDDQRDLRDAIVVGDCSDLCVYQAAMHLRMRANAINVQDFRVIVPANAVDTYDMPIETAGDLGALAHPAGFFHRVFLYHMALNGVQVVREIA